MTRRLLAVLLASALAAPAVASAQLSTSISAAAGISIPNGDFSKIANSGYNAALGLNLGAPLMPVGVRLELGYNGFGVKCTVGSCGDVTIISGTANAVVAMGPTGASPYLIGGVGMYNRNSTGGTGKTVAGVNGGVGMRFPLGLLSTFIEARYHAMLGNQSAGTNLKYIPITFGVSF